MKIKNKTQKKVILGILLVIFGLSAETFSQYYYFDNGGKSYQQGCNETVDIRINTKGENARAGRFHLILDPTTTIYETSDDVSVLRSLLVIGSSQTFLDWSAEIIPSWKSGTNKTILQIDRSNATTDYNGINGLYATVKFKPVFNVNNYDIQFGMEYNGLAEGSESTIETTLSKAGGIELINPAQQELYRTGSYQVLQEPCVSDTKVPTIASVSIANKTTKISHLSGLSFSLKDEGGANGSDVPYIWSGGVWTGNAGGIITNQYGIDLTRGTVTIIGEGLGQTVIPLTAVGVSVNGYKKTWQDNWLNFDVSIPSSLLFDFGVEKTISLVILFYDRAGNTGYYAKTFNAPQGPTLISNSTSPANGAVYVNLSDPIKLGIKDDWAGVNSGTIKITLSGVNGTDYGPYEFTGSALNLSGVQGGANTPDYYINISNHEQFPTSGTIKVRVYALDMEGTEDTISDYTFTTRPNCSEFQCCDPVLLDLGSGNTTYYTNTGLIISGGVNPTFSGDEQNITGVIDCNTENEGLSVYTGEDNFMFFTDESELTILGTGVKGVLSGNVLTLSYIIDSAEIIVDKPSSGQILTTGDVDIRWHLTGVDGDDDWLSGYYIEIYSGDTLITGGFVDGTGITESLSDGEYEFVVYPIDLGGHTGSAATGTFSIDTVVPSVVLTGNDVGMCSPAGTVYTITGVFSEAVTGIDASTLTVTGGTVQSFNMISDTEAVWTVSAGFDGTGITLVSILTGVFEDLAGNMNTTGTDELSWGYDGEGPEFVLDDVEVPECTDGTMSISGVTQVGCASGHVSPYSWDAGDTWGLTGTNTAYSGGIGEKIMTVRVRDAFGNYTEKTGKYTWTNVNPSVDDISVENVGLGTGINWRELSNAHEGECGTGTIEFSGFIDDGSHGTCTEEGGIITYVADTDTEYEGEDSCVFEITDDEGYTATGVITFTGIDTKKPTCEILYNENVCTSGDIALTMNATGAAEYSWNGFTSMSSDNLPHNVHGNGVYTGYVRDNVGNTGICTVEVETFDDVLPIITIPAPAALTAEECIIIEGNIQVVDNGGCGNGFSYLWGGFGLGNDLSYSGYSEVVTGKTATVSVGDPAGNMANGTLNYTWTDTGVQLNSDEKIISDIVLTGGNSYNTTTGDLISLFGAREGNCGEKYISVSKISCNGLSMDIDAEGNIVVTGNNNLTQTGSCELRFSDDDGNSETGTLKIRVDTVVPGVEIQGTNLACMSGSSFSVTGIFTESVQGFVVGNISVENGTSSNLLGNGSEYTWTVNMNPNVEVKVKVPASAAFDLNGNPNTESNELTGMYDTAGPSKVTLSERTKVYSETSKFSWQPASDSGCAGVSGYIRELYEGSCEGTPKDSGTTGAENFTVSGLENSGSYCRRVKAVDNFGNIGEWSDGDEFVVDLSDIGCDFDYVQTCTNGTLQVTLIPGDEGYTDNGTVYLSWQETGDWHNVAGLATGVTYSGQTLIGYIYQPETDKFNSCEFVASNLIDKEKPEVDSVVVDPVPECTTGIATVSVLDEGCGQGTYTYNWNSNGYIESNSFQQYLSKSGTRTINLKVKDNAGNESLSTGVVFVWTDSPISGNNFTGYTGVGRTARTVNWREMSEVSDGDCGSGTITFNGFVDTGTKGTCTRSGDEITYTPNPNEVGDDSCIIQVKDDEGGTKDIIISWEGIDTSGPTCTITKIPEACVSGSVEINLVANETISYAMGGNIQWGLSGNIATGILDINSTFGVEVRDLVGNTGICNVDITNINTGVLDAPVWLSPANGSNTNDNTLTLSWSGVSANGCRGVSGYEVQIIPSGGETITGFTNVNSWTTPELPDGEYTIKVKTIDILGGESEWTEITITIDTEKPTCEIQYDNACISGNVQLTMITTGADFYSWTNFSDMSESLVPNDVSSNGTYYCYVKDLAGNTGINSTGITNIKTGVLSDPSNLTIVGGTPTNEDTPEFTWSQPSNDGCREVSGYIVQILSGGDPIDTIFVDGTGWTPSSPLPDGEYTIIIKTEDTLSGVSEGTGITFVIDTSAPNCSIEVVTENCTNSGVEIKLSGDMSDILTYSWWNGTTGNFGSDITTIVNGNGEYTGYVYDEAGNEGVCVGVVGTGIQDQILISYKTNDAEGFECEVITGSIVGNTGDSCGKDDLSKFTYSRPGGINISEYGTISGNVGIVDIDVTISDGAGNSTGTTVKYKWNDTGVTLSSGVSQNIAVLTGTFEKTVAEIVDLFGATEGACGTGNITVTGTICSGASISIENGIVSINPDADLDGVDGYCEFEFGDNEGEKTTTGKVTFIVDTNQPGVTLTGTNLVCMNTDTFDVTGTFTEAMTGFESGDVDVSGGTVSNFNGNGSEYTWKVHMTPMVETTVFVPAGVATDLNGNENTESNKLIGMYDNVGPSDVTFVNWQDEIYLKNPTIFRNAVSDQGCAGLSGYNWVLSNGNSCNNIVDSGFTTNLFVNLDNLSHEATYTLCVQTVDNFGNTGNRATGGFYVDLNAVGCMFEETECSNVGITLKLKPSNPDWTGIYLSWTGDGYREDEPFLTQYVDEPGKTVVGYVYQTGDNPKQSSCTYAVQNIDKLEPTITSFVDVSVPECTTGDLNITATDEGCGNTGLYYSWDNLEFTLNSTIYSLWSGKAGSRIVDVQVKDNVGNTVSGSATIIWTDSPISGKNITVENVGRGSGVNWRELSEVSDGACGSGTVEFSGFVNNGSNGICTTGEGDTILYVPNEGYTGSDSCTIEVKDDDEQTKEITITWSGIDTEKPSCTLTVQDGQSCTSGEVVLSLNSDSDDVVEYSFDGISWTTNITTGVNEIGTYTGYVKDNAGNISDVCSIEVTGGVLDLDNPTLEVSDWIGYECNTGSITVTGNDNSCGVSGLYYNWRGFENITNTNEIYSGNVGSQTVEVTVFDGVGHSTGRQVTYTWQNIPVTGNSFIVENVGTGITVDWFTGANVSGGICELDDITATIEGSGSCEISGHDIIYTPTEGVAGEEICTVIITDGDEGEGGGTGIEIEITFTGVDTLRPTVELQGGVGGQCTNENTFTVTGTFDEVVQGVTIDTLTGENVEIKGFNDIDGKVYEWIVEMQGGTGKVWINSGEVSDLIGNEMDAVAEFILGNYDNLAPIIGSGISPSLGQTLLSTSFTFEWDESVDQGCAGEITYILQICEDEECENADSYSVSGTGKTVGSLENGTGYWRVISEDAYGNTGVTDIQNFVVDARQPTCSIEPLQMCTTGNVGLVLTVDRDVTIENNGGVDWIGTGKNYTGEVSENGEFVVVVRDVAVVEYTGRCEINVTGHDSRGPEIIQVTGATYECEGATIQINAVDSGCAGISGYNFGLEFGNGEWQVGNTLEISSGVVGRTGGIKEQTVTVEDKLGHESTAIGYILEIKDRLPMLDSGDYELGIITGNVGGIDIISEMGASEGACGIEDLTVELGECTNANGEINNGILEVEPNEGIEENGVCEVYIDDNEGSRVTGYVRYQVDTQAPNCEIIYDITEITNQDVTATLNCSGTSGEDWFATTGEVILTGDGEVIFEFKDENGNTGSITGIVNWIDKTAPECSIEYSPNTPTSGNVTGMLVGCTEPITVTNTSGNVSIYVFENTGTFTFEFVDEAGNTGAFEAIVDRIDKDAPTCTVNVPEGRTNTGVTLTMDVVGDATGYRWDNVDWLGTNTGLFVENTGLYTGYVRDEVRNIGVCTGLVEKIDKQIPTITLEGTNVSGCTNEPTFVVTGIFSEGVSGFTQDKISITNGNISDFMEVELGIIYTWTVTMIGGETKVSINSGVVEDRAWNKNTESNELTSNYDNAGPGRITMIRPDSSSGMNYGSTLVLQWNEVEDQGCVGVSGYVYKVCEDFDCNTVVSGGTTDGTGVEIENLGTGTYYWTIYPEDNYGNTGNETTGQVFVDLTRIGCRFQETACSNTGVILSMFIDGSGTHLSWTGEGYWESVTSLSIEINEPSFSITGYVYDEETNRTGYCEYTVNNIDKVNPTIDSVVNVTGYECEAITGSFVVTDEGCGSGLISYIWDGLDGTNNFEYGLFNGSGNIGRIVYVTGYDGAGNNESTGVSFRWLNSPITWNDFTGNEYVGNTGKTVNWRSESNVSDGNCGSGTVNVLGFINSGSKGECTVDGDVVTYTPHEGQTGSDICVLKVEDDEYDTGSITITWFGIDTVTPSVEISGSDVGMCVPASTTYVVTGIFSENVIFGESIGGVNGGMLTTLGGNAWDFSIMGNTGGVWTIKNDSTYIYEEAVDGINTLTICDPSNSTSCITMMDRNLGAITDDITSTGSYGYHYQWGNNHGFESCYTTDCDSFPGGETTGTGRITNANQYGPNTSWYSGSTFITSYTSFGFISQFDWANPKNDNLWGGENDSRENNRGLDFNNPADRQGPCDTGYHVPSIGERNKVLEYWAEKNGISLYNDESNGNNGGLFGIVFGGVDTGLYYYSGVGYDLDMFQDDFNLSFAGYRDYDGKVHKTNQIYLWSSSPAGNYARVFSLILHKNNNSFGNLWGSLWGLDNDNSDEINISNTDARINAYSIRCFKNEPIIPSSKNIGTLIAIIETGVFKDSVGNFNSTASNELSWDYDGEGPEFVLDDVEVPECTDGTMIISGVNQVGCASGHSAPYSRDAGNTWGLTGTNTAYSGGIGEKIMTVRVRDAFGNYTEKTGKYTWTNVNPSVEDISVENVGLGTGVNWMVLSNAHEGECGTGTIEFSGFIDDGTYGTCTETGGIITYVVDTDTEYEGGDSCIFEIKDDEGYTATGEITFTGVDTKGPTVGLQGGIGEQCTNENTFKVTGVFDEVVQGVTIDTLTGENVEIKGFNDIDGKVYEWTVEMHGGTGRVWILTGGITDNVGNELITGDEKILGNYDNEIPQGVTLLLPGTGQEFNRRTIDFEWTVSSDEGCAGLSGYIVNICRDSSCNNIVETISIGNTGVTITLQDNDDYYWMVIPVDNNGNGNTGVSRGFSVQSDEPVCSIVPSECSSSPVNLLLTGNKEIFIVSGNVTWQQVSPAVYTGELSENIDVWAIVKDSDGQTGYCHIGVESFDNAGPDFEFGTIEVGEGQPLNITIVANDTGCAEISGYNFGSEFGSGEWQVSSGLSITAEQIGNIGGIEKDQVVSVIDTLGNITTKTGKIVINDIKPTIIRTGTIDGVQTGEVIVDVIDLLGAQEGDLGTGDLDVEIDECIYATGYVSGHNLTINVEDGAEGIGYCTVKIKDNEGSYSDVDGVIEFEVDTKEPVCTGLVFNPAGWTSGDSVFVSLTGCSEPIYSGDTTFVFTGNGDHTFEFEDNMGNTGEVIVHFTGFDREGPNFDFNNNSEYECETGTLTISNTVDTGIGLADLPYSFDGMTRNTLNTKQIYSGGAGEIRIPGYVRDKLGNYKLVQAEYVFNDSKPTATGFSLFAFSGAEVNWKELSNATDGACGSGVLSANVSGGSMGTCSISGDIFIYQTNPDVTILSDTCDLTIYDDEGNSTTVIVELKGISSYPDVELVTPINGLVLDPGKVRFAWKGQGNDDMIDKYVYNIWSSNDDYTVEQTGVEVSIDLRPGAYHWNVYAKYIDATTGGLSDTYSFNVVGQSSGLTKDRCPYGDFSQSYYDGTCDASGYHNAADMCGVSTSKYSDELKLAYLYSYSYGITTMCPIESAFLDGYLIRSHFAKMISEFAVNVLGKEPDEGKEGCDEFDDIDSLDAELYDLVITSCELDLMGQESDGVTPAKSFNPNDYVTRAQFGTVLSRLLFGDVYNIKDESKVYMNAGFWYKDHLEALKRYGIMTKIDGDWPNSLERRGWVMLMLQRADEYGVFAGKIPAKNGVKALFDE